MTLIEEYKKQNIWRDWERYLNKIPLNKNQMVYDLGCSIGVVSKLFSSKVRTVVGFDSNKSLFEEANKYKQNNCKFILEDIFTLDTSKLEKCDGIWTSFTIAYMENPNLFISNWAKTLNCNGWFAIVDIDGLFSNHLSRNSKFFNRVELFEKESESSFYDFRIGRKIRNIMEKNGFKIIIGEDDWYDKELNFNGAALPDILEAWNSRLERMVKLKSYLGKNYIEFSKEFLNSISEEDHRSNGGVKFYVGVKK
ncbi:MAG: Methyltransferase type 12 [Firmicutes bacterium]|nr:Methyltransferase type 12 [Bacillota bacterium]